MIPKQEIDYIFDAEDQMLGEIMAFAKRVAKAVSKAVPCKRIGMMVAGLEVPHLHLHLVPIQSVGDLNFAKATAATDEALRSVAESIRRYWR